jgi:heme exporter protein A
MDAHAAISAEKLSKAYGRTWALRGVDLEVLTGERVALLGPNGAGKSTLMRLIATLTRPTRGSLRVCGLDPVRQTREVRRLIGVVAHRPYLYEDLTARENLEFYGKLYGVREAGERYGPLLELAGLARAADSPVRTYSRGMQQRLALVRSLLHEPRVLLLDEPETGLDQEALRLLETVVRSPDAGRTVLFSTHNHDLGLRLADRVIVLAGGVVVYDSPSGAVDSLRFRDVYAGLAGAGAR